MEWLEIVLILIAFYFANEYVFNYWSRRKFPQIKSAFPFGDMIVKLFAKDCFGVTFAKTYEKYKNSGFKAIGFYSFYEPQLLLLDPELIQNVLVRDFQYFHDRGNEFVDNEDPLTHHLFFLTGKKWCELRSKLTPAFTSCKLKGMFPIILSCADILKKYLVKNVENGRDVLDIHDILIRYNTSIASSVEFGVENDCINDPENIFFKMGLKISETNIKSKIQSLVLFFFPQALKYARILDISSEYKSFFVNLVKAQINYREKNEEFVRRDFMQLLIQLMKQGYVTSDKNNNHESTEMKIESKKLSFNEVVSQAFIFYIGGK
jgi:cytochrome P450 family 6